MGKIRMTPDRSLKMMQFSVLIALTVVLQLLCSVMTIGPVTITLSLVPVVIGAALFGASGGALLGFVLGLVNFIASFSNPVLLFLFQSSPVLYILTCFGKTAAAGAVAGLLYKVLRERHPYVGVTVAALSAPVVNTGIFFVMMALFFRDAIRASCGLEGGNVVAFIITGSEIYTGRIQDKFEPVLRAKVGQYPSEVIGCKICDDDLSMLSAALQEFMDAGADLILMTGGMSVDPDDLTPTAIAGAGAEVVTYGMPSQPGNMLLVAYQGDTCIVGVPGAAVKLPTTTLDVVLPQIFTGVKFTKEDFIRLGDGGFCQSCDGCHWPNCTFGRY